MIVTVQNPSEKFDWAEIFDNRESLEKWSVWTEVQIVWHLVGVDNPYDDAEEILVVLDHKDSTGWSVWVKEENDWFRQYGRTYATLKAIPEVGQYFLRHLDDLEIISQEIRVGDGRFHGCNSANIDIYAIVETAAEIHEKFHKPVRVKVASSNLGPHILFWFGNPNLEEGSIQMVYPERTVFSSDVSLLFWIAEKMPDLDDNAVDFLSANMEF